MQKIINMDCVLYSYCQPASNFQNNVLWGSGEAMYKNFQYLELELARPRIDTFQEVSEDSLQNRSINFQRQRVEQSFQLPIKKQFVDFFSRIGLNDIVELKILETGEIYTLSNVRYSDEGDLSDIVAVATFTFDIEAVPATGCNSTTYELGEC